MKRRTNVGLVLLTALVIAMSYMGGALAAPLRSSAILRRAIPTSQQWAALQTMNDLLLDVDETRSTYLPALMR